MVEVDMLATQLGVRYSLAKVLSGRSRAGCCGVGVENENAGE